MLFCFEIFHHLPKLSSSLVKKIILNICGTMWRVCGTCLIFTRKLVLFIQVKPFFRFNCLIPGYKILDVVFELVEVCFNDATDRYAAILCFFAIEIVLILVISKDVHVCHCSVALRLEILGINVLNRSIFWILYTYLFSYMHNFILIPVTGEY